MWAASPMCSAASSGLTDSASCAVSRLTLSAASQLAGIVMKVARDPDSLVLLCRQRTLKDVGPRRLPALELKRSHHCRLQERGLLSGFGGCLEPISVT